MLEREYCEPVARWAHRALGCFETGIDKGLLATKGGHVWLAGQPRWVADGRPAYLRAARERSLRRLRTDCIDLYQLHSIDPEVPASDPFGALAELADNGLIAAAGISNVTIEEFDLAASILGPRLAAAQNEGSIFEQPDPGIVVRCRELSITFIAHSALGVATAAGHSTDHPRSRRSLDAHGTSPAMVAVSALLAGPGGAALIGTTDATRFSAQLQPNRLNLDPQDIKRVLTATSKGSSAGSG